MTPFPFNLSSRIHKLDNANGKGLSSVLRWDENQNFIQNDDAFSIFVVVALAAL